MFEEFADGDDLRVWTREEIDAWDALAEDERRAQLPPDERYREQFGPRAVPDEAWLAAALTEDAAVHTQDLAVQADRMRVLADAHRVAALLIAYERALVDLAHRFGASYGTRGGLGAQAFFRSFGLQIGAHPAAVAGEVDAGLILRDRLPLTWAAFQSGAASWNRMRTAVREAEGLDVEHWAAYDETAVVEVVESTRLKDDLRKARARLDDEAAAKRARTTHERRRTSLELGHDGGVAFVSEGLAADWVPVNDALHKAAVAAHGVEGETRGIAQLRHDIALDILRDGLQAPTAGDGASVPQRKPVQVQLILTVPALAWLGRTHEQAQLGGYGPIDLETAKALAGAATSFIRVLTDPVTGVRLTMDRKVYAPPADLARWVKIRDGRSRFPGSTIAPHLADIDHAREWQHGGATDARNLVTLGRTDHNLKSAGLFTEATEADGTVGWDEVWGHHFTDPPNDPLDPAPPELLPPSADEGDCPF